MDATASSLSSYYAFGAAVALAVLLGVRMRDDWRREYRIHASDVVWTLFYISLLLMVGIVCTLGLMGDDVGASGLGAYSAIMLLCGSLTLFGRKTASMSGVGCASSRRLNSGRWMQEAR